MSDLPSLIRDFFALIDHYVDAGRKCARGEKQAISTAALGKDCDALNAALVGWWGEFKAARHAVLEAGPELAEALDREGIDPNGVLSLCDTIGRNVGPSAIRRSWPRLRAALEGFLSKGKPARRRKRATKATIRPLTARQAEVVQVVGECKGDITKAAKRLGRDRATIAESYKTAMKKLGKTAVKATGGRLLPRDKRGQADLDAEDDARRG